MSHSLQIAEKQKGFTLLESLLALFVLTIGLLGVAAMNSQAMRTGYVAVQRMAVVSKGEELIEKMRANPQGLSSYGGTAASKGCSNTSICVPADMAADDLFIWLAEVDTLLPGNPVVAIQVLALDVADDPTGNIREVTISIDWDVRGTSYNHSTVAQIAPSQI